MSDERGRGRRRRRRRKSENQERGTVHRVLRQRGSVSVRGKGGAYETS